MMVTLTQNSIFVEGQLIVQYNFIKWNNLLYIVERGFSTSTSYEYELRVNENKVQLTRIRDENGKFRSILPDCPNSIPYSTF